MESIKIVGQDVSDEEWDVILDDVDALEKVGLNTVKVINYVDGPVKFVCLPGNGKDIEDCRVDSRNIGWTVGPPYYFGDKLTGYKVYRTHRRSREA